MTAVLSRRWAVTLALSVLLGLLVPGMQPAAHADAGAESQFVSLINQERAAQGKPAVKVASDLTAVARRHSQRMADQNNLHHNPNLGGEVSGWQKVGENVGRGPSASAIHSGFMNSASHRSNILDSDWTQVGVGVVVRDGQMWVTEVFRLPAGTSSPEPEPKPAPEPKPEPKPEPTTTSSSAPDSGASEATGSRDTTSAPEDAPEEPEKTGPRHEIVKRPMGLDRGLLTLARLEAEEMGSSISRALR